MNMEIRMIRAPANASTCKKDLYNKFHESKEIKAILQGIFSIRGAATSLRIHDTISESAKRPQYAIRAERRLIPDTTVRHASHAHAAQHDARQEAANISLSLSLNDRLPYKHAFSKP